MSKWTFYQHCLEDADSVPSFRNIVICHLSFLQSWWGMCFLVTSVCSCSTWCEKMTAAGALAIWEREHAGKIWGMFAGRGKCVRMCDTYSHTYTDTESHVHTHTHQHMQHHWWSLGTDQLYKVLFKYLKVQLSGFTLGKMVPTFQNCFLFCLLLPGWWLKKVKNLPAMQEMQETQVQFLS